MFGKQNKNKEEKPPVEVEEEMNLNVGKPAPHIRMRTMQDDLNELEGKPIISETEEIQQSEESPSVQSDSPFLSDSAPGKPDLSGNVMPSNDPGFSVNPENTGSNDAGKKNLGGSLDEIKKDSGIPGDKEEMNEKRRINWGIIIIITISALAVIAIAGGVYYFLVTRGSSEEEAAVQEEELVIEEEVQEEPEIVVPKYSYENPNYLSIDIEQSVSGDITSELNSAYSESAYLTPDKAFEFVITDSNNNPIAFSRFAYIFGINLESDTLDMLDESFSLYLYNDKGNKRLGLAVKIGDGRAQSLKEAMEKAEDNLEIALDPIFLGVATDRKTGSKFGSGSYGGFEVRFLNLNDAKNISIDYSVVNNYLAIGTSQYTSRAVIDIVSQDMPEDNSSVDTEDNGAVDDGNAGSSIETSNGSDQSVVETENNSTSGATAE